ncbi:site-2 protease family protein [Acetanaerobacterium elongatum]|uniref:Zn-dependent protease (Includes SpoIVFB) n=1 Tax=Acetanaerobacterium elongatum TaxID=258515 RepID=A0A1G9VQB0_9FIRM|nr:site-2 protease family protein [Acetanaerobacterium elongatum]SDM74424.1 Zn-dependent protease (includes SpoIVFB) [Acetanaerobacterium elongatum]
MFDFSSGRLLQIAIQLLAVVAILPIHEFAHAYIADKLGDTTARKMGRLTINPLHHLDLIGTVCLIFTGFGWAKPVIVDPGAFKNPKRGMAVVAAAGPISNLLLALVYMLIVKVLIVFFGGNDSGVGHFLIQIFYILTYISVSLAIFNLLPVPPLDGSRIAGLFLPDKAYFGLMRYERYISIAIFLLLFTGILSRPLSIVNGVVMNFLDFITQPVNLLAGLIH